MLLSNGRNLLRRGGVAGLLAALSLFALCSSQAAQAQLPSGLSAFGGFLKVGGYYLTSSSGTRAIGTPKFLDEAAYYTRPAHIGGLTIAGGAETISATDHFLPFTGGNDFSLIGGSVRISTPRRTGNLRPYLSAGYFLGHLRSEDLGIDRAQLIPSMSLGVEYPISRSATLSASYRISGQIDGINLDGFGISVRFF